MPSAHRRPGSPAPSPRLEALEDRFMPAVIGGFVHEDCNANGVFESSVVGTSTSGAANELGIGGSTLQLLDSNNQVIATTVSDASGRYQFTQRDNVSTQPAELAYDVTFDQAKTDLERTGTLRQFDPALGQLLSVSVQVEGSIFSQVQLENLESVAAAMRAELNGRITFNLPGLAPLEATPSTVVPTTLGAFDGQADFQGSSAANLGVTELKGLFAAASITNPNDLAAYVGTGTVAVRESATATSCACGTGNLLAMIRSMANGKARVVYHYTPSNEIGPGQYTIVQTSQPTGYNDGLDTKDNVTAIPNSNTTDRITLNVVSRSDVLMNNHFGEMKQGSLSGMVYHDTDFSGLPNPGDIRLPGVTLQLTGTDAFGSAVSQTTQTDGNGDYSFVNLTRGVYTISEMQPAGYQQGANNVGSLGGSVSGDSITAINLGCGEQGVQYNFGETVPAVPPPPPPIIVPPPPTPITTPPSPIGSKFFFIGQSWLDM